MKISLLSIKFSQNKLRLHPGTTTFPVIESLSRTLSFDMSIRMVVLCCSYQASTASWHEVSWGTELYDMYRFSPALAFGSCCRDPILARWFAQCWALRARSSSHVSGDALCRARLVLWASRHALESTSNHVCKNILKNYWIKGKKTELKEKNLPKWSPKLKSPIKIKCSQTLLLGSNEKKVFNHFHGKTLCVSKRQHKQTKYQRNLVCLNQNGAESESFNLNI